MKSNDWKIKLAILLIVVSILLYSGAYFAFNEPEKVIFYIVIDLAFIPLDILIVVLVIEGIIERKEREALMEKLDMILGAFFSEIGNELLREFSRVNSESYEIINKLKEIDHWDNKEFKYAYDYLKKNGIRFKPEIPDDERKEYIINLKNIIKGKRMFLIDLLQNPNFLEKASFSNLLLSIFHLDEELELRKDLNKITDKDFEHIIGDIDRVYCRLTYEWILYLEYLNKNYPYMSSIVKRTNPFNPEKEVYITD